MIEFTLNLYKLFPSGSAVENQAAMQETQETQVQSLGQEDPLRKKWQPTPVFLPGRSWTENAGGLHSMGLLKSQMHLSMSTKYMSTHTLLENCISLPYQIFLYKKNYSILYKNLLISLQIIFLKILLISSQIYFQILCNYF